MDCWNLREYRALDNSLAPLLKHTSRYMHSTATDMLFFPTSHGGTGHHKLSDLAQTRKWNKLRRALDTPGEAALAAHGLLHRKHAASPVQTFNIFDVMSAASLSGAQKLTALLLSRL